MATAALRSSDCLKNRFHLDAFASRPPPPTPSPKPQRKKSPKSGRKSPPNRRSPTPPPKKAIEASKKGLVMENVKILKRGEDLDAVAADLTLCTTERIGPEPEILPKKLSFVDLAGEYAGPAFYASPSPSALPMPGFLAGNEYLATKTLRCILRLE